MKRLIIFLIALGLAVGLGLVLHQYPGTVILTLSGWRMDVPLWLGVLSVLGGYAVIYLLVKLVQGLIYITFGFKQMLAHYRQRKAKQSTQKGLIWLGEGRWLPAEKALIASAAYAQIPWFNYLSAAKAAQALGAYERRDRYLRQADETLPAKALIVDLTQAQWQYQDAQYDQSLATLHHLSQKAPHHPYVLKLYHDIYLRLKAWEKLLGLLPQLKHYQVLSTSEILALEKTVYSELFTFYDENQSWESAQALWEKMPRSLQKEAEVVLPYARILQARHRPTDAEIILRKALKAHWNESLIRLYGQLAHPDVTKLLAIAEGWLPEHPESPGLLFALGTLCEQQQLWGKAQSYFEASLKLAPTPDTYAALGAFHEKQDKHALGAQYFKKGLMLANLLPSDTHSS